MRVVGEDRVVVRPVSWKWVAALQRAGFNVRSADVGGPALCQVAALTVVEARRFNSGFVESAQAELDAVDAEKKLDAHLRHHMYSGPVEEARELAGVLDQFGNGDYYPNWVVVVSMNID